ncbi:MAG: helix-turn-helix domain-containing protein [Chloroflexota bacterium]
MRWTQIQNEPCSIARTLAIIGDRWTLLIIRNAFLGISRFDEFQHQLDVTRHLLADRLDHLVENGIFKKIAYQQKPERFEYKLTPKGVELYPILMTLVAWGDKWAGLPEGPPLEYFDRESGKRISPLLIDKTSGKPLDPRKIKPEMGPGLEPFLDNPEFNRRWGTLLGKENKKKTEE